MPNVFAANLIWCLHVLLILFIVLAPFTGDALIILLNLVIMAGIMFHWIVNNQVCCLTELEKICRGKECDSETFFGNLVGPVYSANSNMYSWILILILFAYNLKKLYEKKSQLKSKWEIVRAVLVREQPVHQV